MADGEGGGRDRTEAVGDFPAELLHSSGEHRTGLQDSHTSGAQEGLGSESSHAGKLGTGGLWRVPVQQWGHPRVPSSS